MKQKLLTSAQAPAPDVREADALLLTSFVQ
jgi:hypothetical protein